MKSPRGEEKITKKERTSIGEKRGGLPGKHSNLENGNGPKDMSPRRNGCNLEMAGAEGFLLWEKGRFFGGGNRQKRVFFLR